MLMTIEINFTKFFLQVEQLAFSRSLTSVDVWVYGIFSINLRFLFEILEGILTYIILLLQEIWNGIDVSVKNLWSVIQTFHLPYNNNAAAYNLPSIDYYTIDNCPTHNLL